MHFGILSANYSTGFNFLHHFIKNPFILVFIYGLSYSRIDLQALISFFF